MELFGKNCKSRYRSLGIVIWLENLYSTSLKIAVFTIYPTGTIMNSSVAKRPKFRPQNTKGPKK
jgi:hypothetical protein